MRALVIDDSRTARRVLSRTLNTLGYTDATEAASGAEALELVRRERPFDLIVVDLVMPGMGGLEVIEALRAEQGVERQALLLVVSSRSSPGLIFSAIRAGAQGFVTKPFSPAALRRRLLELRRAAELQSDSVNLRQHEAFEEDLTPEPGQVALNGTIGGLTVLELLQFLSQQGKSGAVKLTGSHLVATVRLRQGSIIAAQARVTEVHDGTERNREVRGEAALGHIVRLNEGRFWLVGPEHELPPEASVRVATQPLLEELRRRRQEEEERLDRLEGNGHGH